MPLTELAVGLAVAAVRQWLLEERAKDAAQLRKIHAVLRTFWTCDTRLHIGEIQFQIDAVIDFALAGHTEHFLGAEIILERGALLLGPTSRAQIIHRLAVDREVSHRRAVFRRHVPDRRAVWKRQR